MTHQDHEATEDHETSEGQEATAQGATAQGDIEWERLHWQRIERLFETADELPEDERQAYLDAECGEDRRLRDRVLALLAAEMEDADRIGGLAAELSPLAAVRAAGDTQSSEQVVGPDESVPDRIGPYEVLREVGRGGSSSVFLVERADGTFRKKVALKLVRRGLDTQDILRRLHQERQILARLDHPHIARLLDGGSLPDGRPYLVMDYAEGLPIDEDCRRRGLGVRARLQLFIDVCRAVHFAHQNLTIHRDIKPSNILVTADGSPKLLDFGIAKVLETPEGISWHVTGPGARFMTPAYASPEQLRGENLSTATDIYSLGVLLHRLLTGLAPYELDNLSLAQLETAIQGPLPRPSQRIDAESMVAMGLPESQLRRHRKRLSGDLDTIVAMALRVEPDRRYSSAEQMADDLQRHLEGKPVRAQPDRWSYRSKKFVTRHAGLLTAATSAALVLILVVTFFSIRLIEERDRAELERLKSAEVSDFLQQIFAIANPSRSQGESVTAVQLLDRGAAQIDPELSTEPELQSALMSVIGQSYAGLGLYPEAKEQLERSLDLRRSLFERPDERLAESHRNLGNLLIHQGLKDEAQAHFDEAYAQHLELFGPDAAQTAESEGDLGAMAHLRGDFGNAEELYRSALGRLRASAGPEDKATLQVGGNLAALLYNLRRFDEAATLGRSVYKGQRRVLGKQHPDTLSTEATLAAILVTSGRYDEAEPLLRELLARQIQLLGRSHPDVALAHNNLGATLFYLKRYDEAEPLYREALNIQTQVLGLEHDRTVSTLLNLADLHALGRRDDLNARPLYEQALDLRRKLVPPSSPTLITPLISLGELELRADDPRAAEAHLREAATLAVQSVETARTAGETSPLRGRLADASCRLAEALERQARVQDAASGLRDALDALGFAGSGPTASDRPVRQIEECLEQLSAAGRDHRGKSTHDTAGAVDHQP